MAPKDVLKTTRGFCSGMDVHLSSGLDAYRERHRARADIVPHIPALPSGGVTGSDSMGGIVW